MQKADANEMYAHRRPSWDPNVVVSARRPSLDPTIGLAPHRRPSTDFLAARRPSLEDQLNHVLQDFALCFEFKVRIVVS
jgi:hypothetical protein